MTRDRISGGGRRWLGVAVVLALSWTLPTGAQTPSAQAPTARRSGSVSPLPTDNLRPEATESGWRIQLPRGLQMATPAVADGAVYIGGGFGSHEFFAFDALSGEPRWAITVSDDGPTTAVAENGLVAFNTESCTLFVVQAQDGNQVWSAWLGDPLMSTPAIRDGRVFMVYPTAATHRLAAFDLRSGETYWEADVDTDAITAPVVVDGDVYVASMAGRLYRFDAESGALHWAREERLTSAPWIRGDQVFAAMHDETEGDEGPVEGLGYVSRDQGVRAQPSGGTWSRSAAPWLSREVQDRSAYGSGNVQADDAVGFKLLAPKSPTGVHPKQQALPGGVGNPGGAPAMARVEAASANIGQSSVSGLWGYQGSRPVLVGDLAIATVGDRVEAVDATTGESRWSHPLSGDVASVGGHLGTPPAYAGGRVWVATTSGRIIALDPTNGEEQWSGAVGAPVRSQPVVVDGRVYVGTTNGQLVMIDSGHRDGADWPMWGGSAAHQPR